MNLRKVPGRAGAPARPVFPSGAADPDREVDPDIALMQACLEAHVRGDMVSFKAGLDMAEDSLAEQAAFPGASW